jgi:Uma2 family endonuclease
LAVEVVSPDSVDRDWHTKYQEYERAGVREYWIADPRHQRFAAYSLRGKAYRPLPIDDDGRVRSKVLKGFFVRAEWFWRPTTLAAVLKELKLAGSI